MRKGSLATTIFSLLLLSHIAVAADLGVIGETFPIKEKNILQVINERLQALQRSGEMDKIKAEILQKTKQHIERPQKVIGLTLADEDNVFTVNPSITLSQDLKDSRGNILSPRGTVINPLERVSLPYQIIFFDADDQKQRHWVSQLLKNQHNNYKIILTNGNIVHLMKEWHKQLYFDQQGKLCRFFNIQHIPAIVSQQGKLLQVHEVKLS